MKPAYRPEIDGLRALAVIPVILFHAGFEVFSGGYTGVDVFFVISGYLITSIIYSELKADKFSIVTFYERRARRILPLLFCVLLATIPFAWISLFQVDMIDYFQSLVAVPTFASNILFVIKADYFDTSANLKPLLHTWSLAVEEQYYVFFPVFMILSWKFLKPKAILPLTVLIGLISFVLSEVGSTVLPEYNFYLLPTRTWELAVGAVLAIVVSSRVAWFSNLKNDKNISQFLSILGFAMIVFGMFCIDEETPFPGSYALLPTVGSMLIIGFASPTNFIGKILSAQPLVTIGLTSYSAYLWHHPVFAFAKHLSYSEITLIQKSLLCFAVFPLSYFTWRFVENPFRNKKRFSKKFIFVFSLAGSVLFISVGIAGVVFDGFPNRLVNTELAIRKYKPDNRKLKKESWAKLNDEKKKVGTGSWFNPSNKLPNLLLVGNSHSKDLYNTLTSSEQAVNNFEIGQSIAQVCDLNDANHDLFKSKSYDDSDIIVLASRYRKEDLPFISDAVEKFLTDNKKVAIVKEIHNFKVINGRTEADIIIHEYQKSKGLNIDSDFNQVVATINEAYYEDYITQSYLVKEQSDSIINLIQIKHPKVIVLDRMKYVCDDASKKCFATDNELQKFFYDYGHNSLESGDFFGKRVDEVGWLNDVITLSGK